MLSQEQDRQLRKFARMIHSDMGEDAYHDAICDMLIKKDKIINVPGFLTVAMKRALYKRHAHEKTEIRNLVALYRNDPIPRLAGCFKIREACKKGHIFTKETVVYKTVQGRKARTCLICKRVSDAKLAQKYRVEKKKMTCVG